VWNTPRAQRAVSHVAVHPTRVGNTRAISRPCDPVARFIPTRGGIRRHLLKAMTMTVHPHACGNTQLPRLPLCCSVHPTRVGNTPFFTFRVWRRFFPTRVGYFTFLWRIVTLFGSSHACGEYACLDSQTPQPGSYPRVWEYGDFISLRYGLLSVHPHACGNIGNALQYAEMPGSSPRVWGIRVRIIGRFLIAQVIPRVWGILCADLGTNKACRFIPTRVGYSSVFLQELELFVSSERVGEYVPGAFRSLSNSVHPTRVGNTS
jgi:hypothetical protein